MKRYVIVNADDFGLSPSVNRGIIEAYRVGTISSASMMVNTPGFRNAARLARRHPKLGVGLHFNLTYGRPVSAPWQIPSLVHGDGRFSGDQATWKAADVTRELSAQMRRYLSTGLYPTHLDAHQHIHVNPLVRRPMIRLAILKKLPMRRLPNGRQVRPYPKTTSRLVCHEYFFRNGRQRFLRDLQSIRAGVTEILCHPGYVDAHVRRLSKWTTVRRKELAVFTNPQIARAIRRMGIEMIHYGQLTRVLR